jgi:GAF domain-containing protein
MTRIETFQETVRQHGLWAAVHWLNQQVPYRFTAIFRFDGDILRNVCLVDKQDLEVTHCPDQPVTDSYCIYIQRSSESFCVDQSLTDPRVVAHPKRERYQSYYGVPLFDRKNRLLGTICHFDTTPVEVTDDIVATLDDLAPVIAECLSTEQ